MACRLWRSIVCRVTKSWPRLSDFTFTFTHMFTQVGLPTLQVSKSCDPMVS